MGDHVYSLHKPSIDAYIDADSILKMDSFLVAVVPSNLQSWSQLGDSGKQMIHLGMSTYSKCKQARCLHKQSLPNL